MTPEEKAAERYPIEQGQNLTISGLVYATRAGYVAGYRAAIEDAVKEIDRLYPLGQQVLGDAPAKIAASLLRALGEGERE